MRNLISKNNLKKAIVLPSFFIIISVVISCILHPKETGYYLELLKTDLFDSFSWIYIFSVAVFLLFLLSLCVGKLGDIRLGDEDEEPEFSFPAWICMLFSAGMGIGLMYFGVAEPISHLSAPLHATASPLMQTKEAMLNTLFHWGIHAWAIYGIVGLSLAYFGFRYRLPVTLRSGLYPLLKHHLNGTGGDVIDVFALCATIFGLTTTLGFGAMQLHAGLVNVGLITSPSFLHICILIFIVMAISVLSAITGVDKGIRLLSQANLVISLLLLFFILTAGPTVYLFSAFTENIGIYLTHIIELSFRTFAYENTKEEWFTSWTITYWAWWVSWAPFVGLFIAKISKGRTIREFVGCVLIIPTIFNIFWMTVFGDSAIWLDEVTDGLLTSAAGETEKLLFLFLDHFPFPLLTSLSALVIITIFFVTSANSGIFVINSIASMGQNEFPKWQTVLWGVLLSLLSIGLLYSGGLTSLQTMTVIIALPFAIIMLLMCACLLWGLLMDDAYFSRDLSKSTDYWNGTEWRQQLRKIITAGSMADYENFLKHIVDPAFEELTAEFGRNGITARVETHNEMGNISRELVVESGRFTDFRYGAGCKENNISDSVVGSLSFPTINTEQSYEPFCYFSDGRGGYSIKYMKKEELIIDVLRQYERYMRMVTSSKHELYLTDQEKESQEKE